MSPAPWTSFDTRPPTKRAAERAPRSDGRADHIPEIGGLRGVAIALIVVYHIWLNRVSGGVDVFFLLSGFLVTMSLVRSIEQHGRVRLAATYSRIARRIFPPALAVLLGVAALTATLLPQTRWRETLGDLVAAAVYSVNWRLAHNAVDYLASQSAASPVQHYWSLAVQAQFYLVWPLLLAVVGLAATQLALRPRRVLAAVLGTVFTASLAYSIYRTGTNQVYAYFDTFARIWEFALGGLLLLALPWLRPGRILRTALGWIGLVALLTCGMVFRGGAEFPGWAALWPTLGAALMILAAGTGTRFGADRLLRSRPLRALGALSYSLYLWHWPILICYLAVTDETVPSARGGLLIVGISLGLAIATKWLLEDRLHAPARGPRSVGAGFVISAGFLSAVLLVAAVWTSVIGRQPPEGEPAPAGVMVRTYPGAAYLVHGGELADVPYRPRPLWAKDDSAWTHYPGCEQNQLDDDVVMCEFGPEDAERTIAVVGASHAHHWLPALTPLGPEHGWRIISITKSACLFSAETQYRNGEPYVSCQAWNDNVMATLAELAPDAIFTTSTRVTRAPEVVPEGYVTHWRALADLGIRVIGVRDTPRPWVDVPECVERHGPAARACAHPPAVYGLDGPDAAAQRADLPENVLLIDLTHLFCADDLCPAVIGNILVYHDESHISATYARTVAPFLGEAILDATGW